MTVLRQRRIWCSLLGREVFVTFEMRGVPGLRWIGGVHACSAFDPPEAVACQRCCTDATYRRQWLPAITMLR
jgi:hypothetical protein